jgi:hypothetical protein
VLLARTITSTAALLAAPVLFWLSASDVHVSESAPGAAVLALLASGVALQSALRRTPEGRHAVLLLLVAGIVPSLARWSSPSQLPGAVLGAAVFAAGYALGTHRRPGPRTAKAR